MDIGIGIPNTMLDAPGEVFAGWAQRAEDRGFSTLATIGRLAYPSHDDLISLTAAAAVTSRIGLFTNVLVAPLLPTALLAKQTATLSRLSGGRFTLGAAVGGRPDDFSTAGTSFHDRGRRFDRQIEELQAAWRGDPLPGTEIRVAPAAEGGTVPVLFGGEARKAAARATRWNGGFTIGGAPPEMAAAAARDFREHYAELGGTGTPRVVALTYFSLGDEHVEESLHNLRTYYAWLGDWVEGIAQGAPRSPEVLRDRIKAYEDAGVDELILDPTVANLDQVDLAADVALG